MTLSKYLTALILTFVTVLVSHYFISDSSGAKILFSRLVYWDTLLFTLFLLGPVVLRKDLHNSSESFVLKFMVVTTLQLLAVLSLAAYVVFSGIKYARENVYHVIAVFILFLFVQSVILVRSRRK